MPLLEARRRSVVETALDILELLEASELPKTHIMYRANLSYRMTGKFLESLEKLGLIQKVKVDNKSKRDLRSSGNIDNVYRISEKGRETLVLGREVEAALGLRGEATLTA